MPIEIAYENPDGLDYVLEAYHQLRQIYAIAEHVEYDYGDEGVDIMLRLPTGEIVDPNDANPLNGLERYITEQILARLPAADPEEE